MEGAGTRCSESPVTTKQLTHPPNNVPPPGTLLGHKIGSVLGVGYTAREAIFPPAYHSFSLEKRGTSFGRQIRPPPLN